MLVYALIASKMVTLANYVAHGYGDAKSAATELHGRAAYSQRDREGVYLSDKKGPFICEGLVGGPYIFIVVGTHSSTKEDLQNCLLDIRFHSNDVLTHVKKPVKDLLQTRLSPILQETLEKYNVTQEVGTSDPNIVRIKNELAEVKDVMIDTIHKTLDREEKLDHLNDKTGHMMSQAYMFRQKANKLKRNMCIDRWLKISILIFLALGGLAILIYLLVREKE